MERGIELARQAFDHFGVAAFWSLPAGFLVQTPEEARLIARIARKQGGNEGWEWAQRIEDAIDGIPDRSAAPAGR